MKRSSLGLTVAVLLTLGCSSTEDPGADSGSDDANGDDDGDGGDSGYGGNPTTGTPASQAKELAGRLGRDHFLIGMGNDLANNHDEDGAYTLGVTMDLHYAYLVGLLGQGGWPDWNENGSFVNILADSAANHGTVPMYTLYSMAANGEGNAAALSDDSYMKAYWDGAKLLFERLGEFDAPAVVHFEPDFWAFTQQQEPDPTAMPVRVTAHASDCAALPDTMVGMGKCLVLLARKYAPKTLVGFHASPWASDSPESTTAYLKQIGAGDADIIVIETLDRDAGCFEAAVDPNCQRGGSGYYWDETNATSPNFHEHLAWAKAIGGGMGRPLLWWQMPFGVPSDTPGGSPGAYRDNRVKYLFEHVDEFIEAGGLGAAFGTGAGNQTYITSDGGQFQNAVTNYFADPVAL